MFYTDRGGMRLNRSLFYASFILALSLLVLQSESAPQAFRRDPGHPQWHHGAFHDVKDSVRSDVRRMLHTRAEVTISHPHHLVCRFHSQIIVCYLELETHAVDYYLAKTMNVFLNVVNKCCTN